MSDALKDSQNSETVETVVLRFLESLPENLAEEVIIVFQKNTKEDFMLGWMSNCNDTNTKIGMLEQAKMGIFRKSRGEG